MYSNPGNIYTARFSPPNPTSQPSSQPSSSSSSSHTSIPTYASSSSTIDVSYCSNTNNHYVQDKIRNYLYICFVLSFIAIGILISLLRQRSDKLVRFSPFLITIEMALFGLDMISDVIYIITLYDYSSRLFDTLASVMLLVRIVHPCISLYVASSFFGFGKTREYYSKLIDRNNLGPNAKLYGLLLLISLVETTAVKFMPWISSEFSVHSGGYPDMFMFRLCGYSKIGQSLVSLLVQVIVLIRYSHSIILSSSSSPCVLVFIVTFVSTVLVVMITVFEIVFQVYNIDDVADDNSKSNSNSNSNGNGNRVNRVDRESSITMSAIRINDEVISPFSDRMNSIESNKPVESNQSDSDTNSLSGPGTGRGRYSHNSVSSFVEYKY